VVNHIRRVVELIGKGVIMKQDYVNVFEARDVYLFALQKDVWLEVWLQALVT